MNNFAKTDLLSKKCVVELKEVQASRATPYLFLTILEENSIRITSTIDVDFYKDFIKVAKKLKKGKCDCDSKTRELLELDIEEIYKKYNYPEEVYIEGKTSYFYDKLSRLMNDAKKFRDISLYSWQNEIGWMKNLETLGCSFYETNEDKAFVTVKMDSDYKKSRIILWDKLSSSGKKYYGMNSYFSVYLDVYTTRKKKRFLSYLALDKSIVEKENITKLPYVNATDNETIGILINTFEDDVKMFTRQLVLPYEEFLEKMEILAEYDDFRKLDYLCEEYNYPRAEIKKRMAECKFIKEMKEKNKTVEEAMEPKKKSFLKRLFGF